MHSISIGTAVRVDEIRERLGDEFRYLQEEGIGVTIDEANRGPYTFLDCTFFEAGQGQSLVLHHVANALSDLIVEKMERDLILQMIKGQYKSFSDAERRSIADHAGKNLEELEERPRLYRVGRKGRILHRLRHYLDQSNELLLEGFVRFRLQDYLEELEEAVDRAVDDFLLEREQEEFVRLLRYFVEVQEPRTEHLHVVMGPGGSFKLLDNNGTGLRSELLEEFVTDLIDSDVNYEDLLLSSLITLAPESLSLHGGQRPEWRTNVETIAAVFGERLLPCPGCTHCEVQN